MKELEKTKRISVAAVVTILVVTIAVLSYKRPVHNYTIDSETLLEHLQSNDYLIQYNQINHESDVIIDVRGPFDFANGHLDQAINMYTPEFLNEQNTKLVKTLHTQNKRLILYGTNPDEAITPLILLKQLGIKHVKMLPIELYFKNNQLGFKTIPLESSNADIRAFIEASIKKASIKQKPKYVPIKNPPKKVIPKKKKKKMPVEGGC